MRAKPRSAQSAIRGVMRDGHDQPALAIAIAAPPADGAANADLIRTMAAALGVRRGAISIATGATARIKLVHISGDPPALMARLAAAISASEDRR